MTKEENRAAIEEGWRNCVAYLAEGPRQTSYVSGVPERTGATEIWRELTIARQRGVILEVHRMMAQRQDMVGAHSVVRLVVQALLYVPDSALKDAGARK